MYRVMIERRMYEAEYLIEALEGVIHEENAGESLGLRDRLGRGGGGPVSEQDWEVIRKALRGEYVIAALARLVGELREAQSRIATLEAKNERLREALQRIRRLPDHESQLWEHGLEREAATHSLLWDAVRFASEALKKEMRG
jgi:hypothetical protein